MSIKSLEQLRDNIDYISFSFRKGIGGRREWNVQIRAHGTTKGYANSYSNKTWFVANAYTLDNAIAECLDKAKRVFDGEDFEYVHAPHLEII